MKKGLFLLLVLFLSSSIFAQEAIQKNLTPIRTEQVFRTTAKKATFTSQKSVTEIPYGVRIGETHYDLQSNSCTAKRLIKHDDETLSAVWTMSLEANATFPDRGTGYNHYDGSSWGDFPTARVEASKTGWPVIGSNGGNEFIYAHFMAGGLYGYTSAIGSGSWTQSNMENSSQGITWPRMVNSGDNVHIIGVNDEDMLWYHRSEDGGSTWAETDVLLPGIEDKFVTVGGDGYAIDANGSTVAIALFGDFQDVIVWKSEDNGDNWETLIVNDFPDAFEPYDAAGGITLDWDGNSLPDTLETCDGFGDLLVDNNGKVHVAFGVMRQLDSDPSDDEWSWFPYTDGLIYWNEDMGSATYTTENNTEDFIALQTNGVEVAYSFDLDGNNTIWEFAEVGDGEFGFGTYYCGITSMPNFACDADNNIYLAFTTVMEGEAYVSGTATPNPQSFRHAWLMKYDATLEAWNEAVDVTSIDAQLAENVFVTVAKNVGEDGLVHLFTQWDGEPGLNVRGDGDAFGSTPNMIIYKAIPMGGTSSVNEIDNASNISIYPNPTNGIVKLTNVKDATISVYNLIGQEVMTIENAEAIQSINMTDLSSGSYIIRVENGNEVVSKQVVKY